MSQSLPNSPSESFRRRNPHLYGGSEPQAVVDKKIMAASAKVSRRLRQEHKPLMNKIESQFWQVLASGNWHGRVVSSLRSQSMRFKLANGVWYKPDNTCLLDCTLAAFEVKGPKSWRGGFENLKVAAGQYPEIEWRLVSLVDGAWQYQLVLA